MKRSTRGHCRPVFIPVFLLILLCIPIAAAADCASGCSCLTPADAQAKGLDYCGGKQATCGYDTTRNAMYCYGSGLTMANPVITRIPLTLVTVTQPPAAVCPSGCDCLTDSAATAKYGSYTRCLADICGYEQVLTHVAPPVPKYCVKKPDAGTCPSGCECMFESAAQEKFSSYERCTSSPCYSVVTGSATVNAYCFRGTTVSPAACPSGCTCMSDATAKARGGTWTRCSADTCGYEQSQATVAAVVQVPKYCMKQETPPCPEGCTCLLEADAKEKGLGRCNPDAAPCAYHPVVLTVNDPSSGKPLYCYKSGVTTTATPSVCPENCGCMSEAVAKEKFAGVYRRCSEKICGYGATATTANGIPEYCFGPGDISGTPTPTTTRCRYDAATDACSGTCNSGASCIPVAKVTGADGRISVVCGCMAGGCSFDAGTKACTGTCTGSGLACQVNTLATDSSGMLTYAECHCKGGGDTTTPSVPCTCDPKAGSCTGSCPDGQTCSVTATAADAAGKLSCTSCACTATCTLNADNTCSGTCPTGAPCTATVFRDDSGAEKAGCGCGGSAPAGATQQQAKPQDPFQSIGNFFKSIFGWK